MNTKFTIITPTYNRSHLIARAIESVIDQAYDNWNYIIIDNASTDQTMSVVEKYAKKDPRIKVVHYSDNVAANKNWERGLDFIGDADYIHYLGDDDFLLNDALKNVAEAVESRQDGTPPDLVYGDHAIYAKNDPVGKIHDIAFVKRDYGDEIYNFDLRDLGAAYLTAFAKNNLHFTLHPGCLFLRLEFVASIRTRFNGYFLDYYPDYVSAAFNAFYGKKGTFISKPLAIIGGLDNKVYCHQNSKNSYFSIDINKAWADHEESFNHFGLPELKRIAQFLKERPYIKSRIALQTLITLSYLRRFDHNAFSWALKIVQDNEEEIVRNVLMGVADNYTWCMKFGDCQDSKLEEFLGDDIMRHAKFAAKKQWFRNLLAHAVFQLPSPIIYLSVAIRNIIMKSPWKWVYLPNGEFNEIQRIILYREKRSWRFPQ